MTLLILAAGTSKPFGEFPKQLLDVGGETLLDRQYRQFSSRFHEKYLVTHREELNGTSFTPFSPPSRRWKCDTLLSTARLWSSTPGDKTIVIHGDVYFTDASVEKIISCTGEPITFFWNGGIEGTEAYALCFSVKQNGFLNSGVSHAVKEAERNNSPPHDCGLMKLMGICEILKIQHDKVALTDGTRDFDHPHKHAAWRKTMGL